MSRKVDVLGGIILPSHMRRHTHLVQLRLTHDEVRGLDRMCRQDMRTRSNLIRLLIAQEVVRRQGLKSPGLVPGVQV